MDILLMLKALSDENRLKIVQLLSQKKYCVRALSRQLGISEPAVSQHIRVLKQAGILQAGDKKGYNLHYAVNKDTLLLLSQQIATLALDIAQVRECGGNCREEKK